MALNIIRTAIIIIILSIYSINAQSANQSETESQNNKDELLRLREELDSAKTLLEFHGIKPFKHRVVLSAGVAYEIMVVNFGTRLALNLNSSVSPYIGAALGIGSGISLIGSAGVEKYFVYKNGLSIRPSLGAYYGEFGYSKFYQIAGMETFAEFSYRSHYRRFSPYLLYGARYIYVFGEAEQVLYPFIVGAGLSLKI